ncbi:MAG: hypothetical protein R2827_12510 [Bdellovibrionales bacterium]
MSLCGCAGASKLRSTGDQQLSKGIFYRPVEGSRETQTYLSYSETRKYEENELIHKKIEEVAFDVEALVKKVDENLGQVLVEVTTRNKRGDVDLHALAFPENDETLKFVFDEKYNVLLADQFPRTSLFYIPPVFLPLETVEVGGTWSNKKEWLGLYNNLPLRIDVTSILQDIVHCPGGEKCANIEVSGRVNITGEITNFTQLDSLLHGRYLLGVDTGTIYWSAISSKEILTSSVDRVEIDSCLVSYLKKPEGQSLAGANKTLKCDHKLEQAPSLP